MEICFNSVIDRIENLFANRERIIVAIDGNCAAGKTTLAAFLSERYDCNVFHMDDFFLRSEQRMPARLQEPGGNVDYERFGEEVLLPLRSGGSFSYRPYDCGAQALSAPVSVMPRKLNIVEGTYALHPYFGDVYDLKIFLSISPEDQRRRILKRPLFLHRRFFEEWIPMEKMYFDTLSIPEKCDVCYNLQSVNNAD